MKLLVDFLLVSGFVFSVIVIFLTKKSNQKPFSKRILTRFYILSLIYIVTFYFQLHDAESIYYQLLELACLGLILLIGPLLYFYIESVFTTKSKLTRKDYLHFLMHPIFWIFTIGSIGATGSEELLPWVQWALDHDLFYWFETLVFVGYIVYSIYRYHKFHSIYVNNFSSIDERKLDWTKKFLYGLLLVMVIDMLCSLIEDYISIESEIGFITIIAYIVLLVYLAYDGTYKTSVFIPQQMLVVESLEKESIEVPHKIEAPTTDFLEMETVFNEVFEIHKPYLDSELNLNQLAKLVGTTDKKLSSFLNQHLETTFYEFINKNRVEAVKEKLLVEDLSQYSIMGIATDCGFKSKSSFNRIFKNETGLSPTQFIASQKEIAV